MKNMTTKHEPLVPISEFGVSAISQDQIEAWAEVTGVRLHVDFLDRVCVDLPDAYRLAENRRQAEAEWHAAESRRHVEHAAAVKALGERLSATFVAARDAELQRLRKAMLSSGEKHAAADNAGLVAARTIWAAAPVDVRSAVQTLRVEEQDGTNLAVDLGTVLPRATIDDYLHAAAKNY